MASGDNKNTGSSNAPQDKTPIFPDVVPNMAANDDPGWRSQQSLGDGQGADVQPLSDLQGGFDYFSISDLQQAGHFGFIEAVSTTLGIWAQDADVASSKLVSAQSFYGMGKREGSAAQMKESKIIKKEPASDLDVSDAFQTVSVSGLKKSNTFQWGESSHSKRRKIEVPLTIREGAPAAPSQEVSRAPASEVNLRKQQFGSETLELFSLYDPLWRSVGLPQDPFLRRFLEVKEQEKDNKNK